MQPSIWATVRDMHTLIEQLERKLSTVRLGLEPDGAGFVVRYEKEVHPVATLPLDDIDERAEGAEVLAVAAGIEAAVKLSGPVRDENFGVGAASLLARVERARFAAAYDAVVDARGGDEGERLCWTDLGAGLVAAYVFDAGWSFTYVSRAQADRWGASGDRIHSAARSNLYARAQLPHSTTRVAVGDGYDASRALIASDVFFHLATAEGLTLAVPSRDLLLVGPDASPEGATAAFEAAAYPISPAVFRLHRGCLSLI